MNSYVIILVKIGPNNFGDIILIFFELTQIVSQVFFEMNLYVMILVKIA